MMIHPTAKIHPEANIARNVQIGAYCKISKNVILKTGVKLEPHVTIERNVTIAEDTHLYPFSRIGNGSVPISIGQHCHIREFTKIGTRDVDTMPITISSECYIMAYCNISDGVTIKEKCILTNHVVLGSGVYCQEKVIVGAKTNIKENCTIGSGCMLGAVSNITYDMPPFCLIEGSPIAKIRGLNLVGMRRSFSNRHSINSVKKSFLTLKKTSFDPVSAKLLLETTEDSHAKHFISFILNHTIEQ